MQHPKTFWKPGDRRSRHAPARQPAPPIVLTIWEEQVAHAVAQTAGPEGLSAEILQTSALIRLMLAGRVVLREGRLFAP